ncbi:MAG: hypothetical protein ACRDOK_22155 [Streptosporangiaceae bacterium]
MPLQPSTSDQQVYLKLTGSLTSGTVELMAPDGSSLRALSSPSGDGITSSSAQGGNGGGISVSVPTATTNVKPTVVVYVDATSITAGWNGSTLTTAGDVSITSSVSTHATSSTQNGSGGFIAIPSVSSNINGSAVDTALIGDGSSYPTISGDDTSGPQVNATDVSISVGGNITVAAQQNTAISADTFSGGLGDFGGANSQTSLTGNMAAAVSSNAIISGSTVAVEAAAGAVATGSANATAIAFIGSASATTTTP